MTGTRRWLSGSLRSVHLQHLHASYLEASPGKPITFLITPSKWILLLESKLHQGQPQQHHWNQRNWNTEDLSPECVSFFLPPLQHFTQRCHFGFQSYLRKDPSEVLPGITLKVQGITALLWKNSFLSIFSSSHSLPKALCKILIHELIDFEQMPGAKAAVVGMKAECHG